MIRGVRESHSELDGTMFDGFKTRIAQSYPFRISAPRNRSVLRLVTLRKSQRVSNNCPKYDYRSGMGLFELRAGI